MRRGPFRRRRRRRRRGWLGEAIELLERVVADSERLLGEDHPDTVNARQVLLSSSPA
ncbi:tetratricopeptide repeat protein [Streptomyces microflavus]|uniref:tetratricopeptide repeat protein n=1 Tax=Streptomyces microflavus TaxID=1919 RepID=UPI0036505D10